MSTHRFILSRFVVVLGLLTAVLALSTVYADQPVEEVMPERVIQRDLAQLPFIETNSSRPPEQLTEAVDLVPYSWLTFQSFRDGNWEIYNSSDDGASVYRVTNHERADIQPRYNRGLSSIAFSSNLGGAAYKIYTINPDGTGLVQLTTGIYHDYSPYWSPDGNRIVFYSFRDGQAEVYVMNADGSNQTRLTYSGDFDGQPSFSPDGTKIAFVSRRTGGYRVYAMNADGSNQVQLSDQAYSFDPVWSPDGSKIAYDADGSGDGWLELWVMDANGINETLLINSYSTDRDIWARSWSPDGRYIAYTSISYVEIQGNWYWTYAYLQAYDTIYSSSSSLNSGNKNWYPDWQTLDPYPPTSAVNPLPATSAASFTVSWAGSDSGVGGLANYVIQVKVGNSEWENWLVHTTDTSATYTGTGGTTYAFRSRAYDWAGNVEAWPTEPDATTTVDGIAPQSAVHPLSDYSPDDGFLVTWSGYDPGDSGIQGYDVQYRAGSGGNWVNWQTGTTATAVQFTSGNPGTTYYFRARATDHANNIEAWPSGNGDAFTTLYAWAIRGTIEDNSGIPVALANSVTTPGAAFAPPSDINGEYVAYVNAETGSYMASWDKTGYGTLPNTTFPFDEDVYLNVIMPPIDDVVQNGGFETGAFTPWVVSGTISVTPGLTNTSHTGEYAALLGQPPVSFGQMTTLSQNGRWPEMVIDQNETVHMVWHSSHPGDIYYAYLDHSGIWSTPQNISNDTTDSFAPQITIKSDGMAAVVWNDQTNGRILYTQKQNNGSWSSPQNISAGTDSAFPPQIEMAPNGTLHVIWATHQELYHTERLSSGNWTAPHSVAPNLSVGAELQLLVDERNNVHVIWTSGWSGSGTQVYYAHRQGGTWASERLSDDSYQKTSSPQAIIDEGGTLHLTWLRADYGIYNTLLEYLQRTPDGTWLPPYQVSPASQNELESNMMFLGQDGKLSIGWSAFGTNFYLIQRDSNGNWAQMDQVPFSLSTPYMGNIVEDGNGIVHIVWSEATDGYNWYVAHIQRGINDNWSSPEFISGASLNDLPYPELLISDNGSLHIAWDRNGTNIEYLGPALAQQPDDYTLTQQVTIPISMSNLVLSFVYKLGGVIPGNDSALSVEVDDGSANTSVLSLTNHTYNWVHQWADLSAWAGQTVSITFRLHQEANTPLVWAYLDDITLGSAHPDVWVGVNDTAVLPGEQVIHTLTYANRGGAASESTFITYTLPAEISFVSASVPPTSVNGSVLVWEVGNLPAKSDLFTIEVTGTVSQAATLFDSLISTAVIATTAELETLNNIAEGVTFIGRLLYLPIISKN